MVFRLSVTKPGLHQLEFKSKRQQGHKTSNKKNLKHNQSPFFFPIGASGVSFGISLGPRVLFGCGTGTIRVGPVVAPVVVVVVVVVVSGAVVVVVVVVGPFGSRGTFS